MNEIQFKASIAAQVLPVATELTKKANHNDIDFSIYSLENEAIDRAIKIAETIIERISNS